MLLNSTNDSQPYTKIHKNCYLIVITSHLFFILFACCSHRYFDIHTPPVVFLNKILSHVFHFSFLFNIRWIIYFHVIPSTEFNILNSVFSFALSLLSSSSHPFIGRYKETTITLRGDGLSVLTSTKTSEHTKTYISLDLKDKLCALTQTKAIRPTLSVMWDHCYCLTCIYICIINFNNPVVNLGWNKTKTNIWNYKHCRLHFKTNWAHAQDVTTRLGRTFVYLQRSVIYCLLQRGWSF